ncbi:MAG: ParB/RepB/Spo0J family partition protein, partial [Gammaproteobacteria bacterium]
MQKKSSTLGRGLQSLLGNRSVPPVASTTANPATITDTPSTSESTINITNTVIHEVPIEILFRAPYQPRRIFDPDRLAELADSIRAQGILQPIVVRKHREKPGYEIIAGERRWRAAQQAELTRVPVIVREVDDKTAMALALIENVQRQDLTPIEEALALQQLLTEYQLTQHELADLLGKSRTTITNILRLLNLEPEVQNLMNDKHLELGHAKVLLGLNGHQQKQAAHEVKQQQLSVRATEQLVKRILKGVKSPVQVPRADPDIERLQQKLSEQLSAAVMIKHGAKGKGELIIKYHTLDELSGIL